MRELHNHLTPEEIAMCAEALNGKEYQNLPNDFHKHLEECDECAAEVVEVAQISMEWESMMKTKFAQKKFNQRILIAVSSIAAVLVLFLVFKTVLNNETEKPIIVNNTEIKSSQNIPIDTTTKSIVVDNSSMSSYNKKFESNRQLEILYNNHKDAYRSDDVIIISKGEIKSNFPISLKWKNPNTIDLSVEIFDNKENIVFQKNTNKNAIVISTLPKGLYYWKLIDEDYNLIYVGKIISN